MVDVYLGLVYLVTALMPSKPAVWVSLEVAVDLLLKRFMMLMALEVLPVTGWTCFCNSCT